MASDAYSKLNQPEKTSPSLTNVIFTSNYELAAQKPIFLITPSRRYRIFRPRRSNYRRPDAVTFFSNNNARFESLSYDTPPNWEFYKCLSKTWSCLDRPQAEIRSRRIIAICLSVKIGTRFYFPVNLHHAILHFVNRRPINIFSPSVK